MARTRYCQVCKQPIEPERAEGMPETRLCAEHGRQIEKFGGEFITRMDHERISKPGSLKRNYGGITFRRRRNEAAMEKLLDDYERQQFEREEQAELAQQG